MEKEQGRRRMNAWRIRQRSRKKEEERVEEKGTGSRVERQVKEGSKGEARNGKETGCRRWRREG